ncbi:hypothetical protein [Blautia sp.]|uniref:hypothetical protein n=1 Tax=Blautia sp. TaxID=1955243 RepID=UPI00258533DD|nr:hypothetical protein [Blautia sp.]
MACLKTAASDKNESDINSTLSVTADITLGSKVGITAYYRYNEILCEVRISGKLSGVNFTAWTGYLLGTLPEKCRPKYYAYVKLESNYYMQISPNGEVRIISSVNITGASATLSGQTLYFL